MNKKLINEINRIHVLVYGKEIMNEQEKADVVSDNITEFFNTLKSASESGGLSQQKKGSINFQKAVESMQIGLTLLGYELPRYGIDGLFGTETSSAVKNFAKKELNDIKNDGTATPQVLNKMIELLKSEQVKPDDLKKYIDNISSVNIGISLTGDWIEITKNLLRSHEGFRERPYWDENAWRAGYGTDKKLVNGQLVPVTKDTIFTKQDAENTLDYQIKNNYAPPIIKQLGNQNWSKLNDRQKAALVSLGYNAGPYFLTKRDYGIKIKNAIEDGNMELAAEYIKQGPTRGSVSGQYYAGLEKRRGDEADIFLS